MGKAYVWDGTTNAWDSAHWGQDTSYPGGPGWDNGEDSIVIATALVPSSMPADPITCIDYTCQGSAFDSGANITVTGDLVVGNAADTSGKTCTFSGDASDAIIIEFAGHAVCAGIVGDHATFASGTTLAATAVVGDYATIGNVSVITGAVVGGYASVESASLSGISFGVGCSFHDVELDACAVGARSVFNGASLVADCSVASGATFNGYSHASGTTSIGAEAVFNDGAYLASRAADHATFNGASYSTSTGIVADNATFASTATQNGTFTGSAYRVTKPTTFNSAAKFINTSPITITLDGPGAKVTGAYKDGSGVSISVTVAARPDVGMVVFGD